MPKTTSHLQGLQEAVSRARSREPFLRSLISENLERIAALQKANARYEQEIADARRILPALEIKFSNAKSEQRAEKLAVREELLAKLAKLEETL